MAIHAAVPSSDALTLIEEFKTRFAALDHYLVGSIAEGAPRELALARTHLETASMYASKAACNAYPLE